MAENVNGVSQRFLGTAGSHREQQERRLRSAGLYVRSAVWPWWGRSPPPNLNLIYSLSWKTDSMFKCSAETLIRLLLWGLISCRVWFIVHRLVFPLSHSNSGPTDSANETAESQPETVCCLHQRETPMIHQSFSVHEKLSGTSRCLPQTLHPAVQKKCSRKREERKCRITL